MLNALLSLKSLTHSHKINKGPLLRSRLAASYLNLVVIRLEGFFTKDKKIIQFLKWCEKKTLKMLPWGFKKKELREPPKNALPIYKDEAAAYVKHFLRLACLPTVKAPQHAEMVIFLSLCLACARRRNNYFDPVEILKISKDDIMYVPIVPKKPLSHSTDDIIEISKASSVHRVLLLALSSDFLLDDDLWRTEEPKVKEEAQDLDLTCKIVRIRNTEVLISRPLALAIEIMGRFTITKKDVENRLKEAFGILGLSQSTGGISPRCFLYDPHHLKGIDQRKNWSPKIRK